MCLNESVLSIAACLLTLHLQTKTYHQQFLSAPISLPYSLSIKVGRSPKITVVSALYRRTSLWLKLKVLAKTKTLFSDGWKKKSQIKTPCTDITAALFCAIQNSERRSKSKLSTMNDWPIGQTNYFFLFDLLLKETKSISKSTTQKRKKKKKRKTSHSHRPRI